jgi:hypothetical protein
MITAILIYPGMIEALVKKAAQKQINTNIKKSHFKGHQTKNWTDILTHPLFTIECQNPGETHNYQWLLSNEEQKLPEEK